MLCLDYIFVEGNDDARFIEHLFEKLGVKIKHPPVKYAQKPKEKMENYIRSIKSMESSYIFLVDINNAPCVTAKKEQICHEVRHIDENKIFVVIKEIESWYLAGLDEKAAKKLGIKGKIPKTTDEVTKEQFNSLIPKKFDRIDFMQEILKNFSLEIAMQKNKSLRYFIEKGLMGYCENPPCRK